MFFKSAKERSWSVKLIDSTPNYESKLFFRSLMAYVDGQNL